MNKIFTLLFLASLLVNLQLTLTEDKEENSSEETETSEATEIDRKSTTSNKYKIMDTSVSKRIFFITINSDNPQIASRISEFSDFRLLEILNKAKKVLCKYRIKLPKIAEILLKLKMIEDKLNQNYENAVEYKKEITRKVPEAETEILVNEKGFLCDRQFCEQAGKMQYGMGICTPFYCDCRRKSPKALRCRKLFEAFDPVYMNCDAAYKIKICGF